MTKFLKDFRPHVADPYAYEDVESIQTDLAVEDYIHYRRNQIIDFIGEPEGRRVSRLFFNELISEMSDNQRNEFTSEIFERINQVYLIETESDKYSIETESNLDYTVKLIKFFVYGDCVKVLNKFLNPVFTSDEGIEYLYKQYNYIIQKIQDEEDIPEHIRKFWTVCDRDMFIDQIKVIIKQYDEDFKLINKFPTLYK